jgi:hypothetical protein
MGHWCDLNKPINRKRYVIYVAFLPVLSFILLFLYDLNINVYLKELMGVGILTFSWVMLGLAVLRRFRWLGLTKKMSNALFLAMLIDGHTLAVYFSGGFYILVLAIGFGITENRKDAYKLGNKVTRK